MASLDEIKKSALGRGLLMGEALALKEMRHEEFDGYLERTRYARKWVYGEQLPKDGSQLIRFIQEEGLDLFAILQVACQALRRDGASYFGELEGDVSTAKAVKVYACAQEILEEIFLRGLDFTALPFGEELRMDAAEAGGFMLGESEILTGEGEGGTEVVEAGNSE